MGHFDPSVDRSWPSELKRNVLHSVHNPNKGPTAAHVSHIAISTIYHQNSQIHTRQSSQRILTDYTFFSLDLTVDRVNIKIDIDWKCVRDLNSL